MRSRLSPHVLLVAAGYGLGAALYPAIPDEVPLARPMAAFLLPTAAAVTYGLLRGLCTRHPVGEASPDAVATYDAVMLRLILFLMGVHATVLLGLQGMLWGRSWAARIVPVLLGLAMIGIGNLLPRTRPNLAIGIRTARTLADRAQWAHTHRIAGYALVGLGLVVVVAGVALPPPIGPGMIQLVAPVAALGVLVLRFKRHADGVRS
jgi:immunity protein, SdpI family